MLVVCVSTLVPLPGPGTLQEVEVSVIGNKQCTCMYSYTDNMENIICAGVLEGGKDACQVM